MIERLILWLCARFNVHPVEQMRIHGGTDAVERGQRWDQFCREQGGLYDMLEAMRREAFEAASELPPEDTDKIYYWAMADRNVRRLKQRIEAVVATGKIEGERNKLLARENSAVIRR